MLALYKAISYNEHNNESTKMNFELMILAMAAVGWFAAQVLPKDTATEYRPWTEADFDYVVKRELGDRVKKRT